MQSSSALDSDPDALAFESLPDSELRAVVRHPNVINSTERKQLLKG
jgi:hypothetical protein